MPHEVLTPDEVSRRFPAFRLPEDEVAVLDPRAGYVAPEDCVAAHLDVARSHGAVLRFDEPLVAWEADGRGRARDDAARHATWLTSSCSPSGRGPRRSSQSCTCRSPSSARCSTGSTRIRRISASRPIASRSSPTSSRRGRFIYGFPRLARGVKCAVMHEGERVPTPTRCDAPSARMRRARCATRSRTSCRASPPRPSARASSASSRTCRTTTF